MTRLVTTGLVLLMVLGLSSPRGPRMAAGAGRQAQGEDASTDARIGEVSSIVCDPHDPATFYAVASGRGIFKSTDGAETWRIIGAGITSHDVFRKVVIDPKKSNVLYIEGGTSLLKSTDGGDSWSSIAQGLGDGPFWSLAVNPVDSSVLYVPSPHKIFQTSDGGQTWRAITSELRSEPFGLIADPKNPAVLYGLWNDWLAKSEDAGEHWSKIGPPGPSHEMTAIAISPTDSSVLYIGTAENGIYRSADGGKSWSARNSGLMTRNLNDVRGEIPRVWVIAIDPSDPTTIYAGGSGNVTGGMTATIFKSTDSARSWRLMQVIGRARGASGVICLLVNPFNHNIVLAGADGDGIYKSIDGGLNWSAEDAALSTADLVAFDVGKSDGALYAATSQGVFHFKGQRWRQVGFSSRDFLQESVNTLAVDPTNSETVYVGTGGSYESNYGGLFKTIDGGLTWSEADEGGLRDLTGSVHALSVDPSEPSTVYAGMLSSGVSLSSSEVSAIKSAEKAGISIDLNIPPSADPSLSSAIYKTTNGGKNWMPWDSGIPRHEMSVRALFLQPNDATTLYALTPSFTWKSTNAGLSWAPLGGLPAPSAFAISPSNPSLMYSVHFYFSWERDRSAATVFASTDAGLSWFSVGNAGKTQISHLAVDPHNPTIIYADNGDNGILKSMDAGRTWTAMSLGLPRPVKDPFGRLPMWVTGLVIDPIRPDTIYISTNGRGLFESTDGGSSWHSKPTD
jgi:photosystem II stability/assembly factor-like uncharacterized protein